MVENQENGYDEKNIHADEAAFNLLGKGVKENNKAQGNGAQVVDIRTVLGKNGVS